MEMDGYLAKVKSTDLCGGLPDPRDFIASPCNLETMNAELNIKQNAVTCKNEKSNEKDKTPRTNNRFKRLVRMIMTNAVWAKEAADKAQKNQDDFKTECGEKLTFNLNAFRAHVQSCGKLSPLEIEILSKPSQVRDETEIKILQKILYRLKCFDRYPLFVKQELARVIYYDKFGDGRLIIKQGHLGSSFYFIVSGSVVVERLEYDPFIKEYYTQRVGELQAGDSFGELALLHNTKRAASILCRGTSEFIRVDKPDFDEVLRNSHQREWEIRINLLSTHHVFRGWAIRELKLANGQSKMKTYPPNTVIVSEKKQFSDRVFFIASGMCSVVRKIDLVKKFISKRKYKYMLPPITTLSENNDGKLSAKQERKKKNESYGILPIRTPTKSRRREKSSNLKQVVETRYFMVTELTHGEYFNVGENMEGLYVISVGRVQIVQVSRLAFARHNGTLENMRIEYIQKIPSFADACKKYIADRKWECYKKNIVKEITARRRRKEHVEAEDVPGVRKAGEIYYFITEDIV